jgi:cation diffusion facilitator CzcD-associated flavoprotein CzcO
MSESTESAARDSASATTEVSTAIPAQPGKPRVAIVGSGFSGLCLAIHLRKAGIESFRVYEKADAIGGTWRDNTYPGSACDLASFAYCFSFEQKTDWSRKWSPQAEILAYMEHCASRYDINRHICFDTEVTGAAFDESKGVWSVRLADGTVVEAEVLISGVGQLSRPYIPEISGLEDFGGHWFHSARWDHGYDLAGKRVAVLGNAASAIQFIPQIAPKVEKLYVLQRSANWMFPRNDRFYSDAEKARFTNNPWLARLYRWWIWLSHELWFPVFAQNRVLNPIWARLGEKYMRSVVTDPALQDKLVPDYPIGGKRILISDDYYQTLNRDNVELVFDTVDHMTNSAVVTRGGRELEVDALILGTGFLSTEFLAPMDIYGSGDHELASDWKGGARAFLGMTMPGYPNFFMMYGPNTNLGHNSIIFMIECQTGYIMQCIRALMVEDLAWMDLRPEVMEAFDRKLQADLGRTAWAATARSWYKTATGRITNNWSGTTTSYWWNTRRLDRDDYRRMRRTELAAAGAAGAGNPTADGDRNAA